MHTVFTVCIHFCIQTTKWPCLALYRIFIPSFYTLSHKTEHKAHHLQLHKHPHSVLYSHPHITYRNKQQFKPRGCVNGRNVISNNAYLYTCTSVYLYTHISVYLYIRIYVHTHICISVHLCICISVYLHICVSVYLYICSSACSQIHTLKQPLTVCLHAAVGSNVTV